VQQAFIDVGAFSADSVRRDAHVCQAVLGTKIRSEEDQIRTAIEGNICSAQV
jgi:aerobic-type carbon monoxide dehydrogenase small subunit (CoxS/CutS family)